MPASSPAMRRVHNLPDGVIDLVGGGRTLEQIREAVLEGGPALPDGGNEVHEGGKDGEESRTDGEEELMAGQDDPIELQESGKDGG